MMQYNQINLASAQTKLQRGDMARPDRLSRKGFFCVAHLLSPVFCLHEKRVPYEYTGGHLHTQHAELSSIAHIPYGRSNSRHG